MKRLVPFALGLFLQLMPEMAGDGLQGPNAGWFFVGAGAVAYFVGFMSGSSDDKK